MSLGKDLASIRKSQNLTLEDIQNAIKIPLDTLKSIENGSIFNDPSKNKTYIRSFVRSYAKVLKIEDEEIVQALDEMEAGTYSGGLIHEPKDDISDSAFTTGREAYTTPSSQRDFEEADPEPVKQPKKTSQTPPPEVDSINWADLGRKFTTAGKSSRIWLFVVLFVIIGALAGSGYYFWEDIADLTSGDDTPAQLPEPEPSGDPIVPTPLDSAQAAQEPEMNSDTENQTSEDTPQAGPIELKDTLTISVYAAYGQLEPVRVTSDLNWRTNPFWMEEGESFYFDFNDTLLVRGQYSRMLLMFNGHVIENPRQNYFNPAFNSIMITRSVLNQPRYLAAPPEEFPLEIGPPDSTVYRIRF